MEKNKQQYGLFTAISMIVGIAIGAGVFFKTDEILKFTGGNVALGVLVFCIGAFNIIFGSLTVAELAIRSTKSGGVIGYYEEFIHSKIAAGFGWFQLFIYFPTLGTIVSYVGGNYICFLIGVPNSLENRSLLGFLVVCVCFLMNVVSSKLSSYFQNSTTIIKLIPLLALTVAGFVMSGNKPELPQGIPLVQSKDVGLGWIAALVPIAFTYDGWIITTSIAGDVKNPKKTMPRALMIGPIIVLASYVLYFIGINSMLGPEYIMSVGNEAVNIAGRMILGSYGEKILLTFITISTVGVVNGVVMGICRMPHTLQTKKMLPGNVGEKVTVKSSFIPFLMFAFWSLMNYLTFKFKILGPNSDISSIAIVFGYFFYFLFYLKTMKMFLNGEIKSKIKGLLYPIFAIIGALIIIIGGFMSDPIYAVLFTCFSLAVVLAGINYYKKHVNN